MVRPDRAGMTHELADYCREGNMCFSLGYDLTDTVRQAILAVGRRAAPRVWQAKSAPHAQQDMPPIRPGMPMPFGASQEAVDAWQALWPDERVPALCGVTPRTASRRVQSRPRPRQCSGSSSTMLTCLRERAGPLRNLERIRAELGMHRWREPTARAHRRT